MASAGDSQAGTVTGDSGAEVARLIASRVTDVLDFPKPGIVFKDLSPLFGDGRVFRRVVDEIIAYQDVDSFDVVAGIEARGFMLASAIAYASGRGVVPVRKAGKLPREVLSVAYDLEYGQATLEVHTDAFEGGARVLVVDDVLATGGTAQATLDLIEGVGGRVSGFSVVVDLSFLGGRDRLGSRPVHALLVV
jgi:adenine phosphoribosyltransferase